MSRPQVGVAISTYNRRERFNETVSTWRKFHNGPLVVVDDGSDIPVPDGRYELIRHPQNLGIAAAKNSGLAALADLNCQHMFLVDDDTVPTRPDWADGFIHSPEPFLIHGFGSAPSHWATIPSAHDGTHIAWDKPRGCLMYVYAPDVLPVVGGLHTAFGKHGGEHGNWADRIRASGLTSGTHLSLIDSPFHCADEDEAGISSVEYSQQWRHVDPKRLPLYAEYRRQPIPVLVPRRNDHGHRDRLWRWTQDAYWSHLRGYRIVEGHHVEGPFNRGLGINLAADIAGNWDVAIIADSDAWVPPEQLAEAVRLARDSNRLVAAFSEVHEVGEKDTHELLSGNVITTPTAERVRTKPLETQSVMLAVTRNLFEQVRGFDPKHVGWSAEDNSFWAACKVATGEPLRVGGPVFSLWHEPASRANQPANAALFRKYQQARTLADIHRLRAS